MKDLEAIRCQAEAGEAAAQAQLGWLYDQGQGIRKSHQRAFYWYLKAAQGGHRVAQYNLNLCYLLGQGVQPDDKKAFYWIQRSAEAGYPDAFLALAWHYHNGCGIKTDLRKAHHWYRKSAQLGEASAQFSLGQIYFSDGNYTLAKKWFQKGILQEHPRSYYYLARMYLEGLGVCKDAAQSKTLLAEAARFCVRNAKRLLQSQKLKTALALQHAVK
jgi:hypothetical protein